MSDVVVELARPDDDALLRRLLRETPMQGALRLTLEREPSLFQAAAVEGPRHAFVVARERAGGEPLGLGARSVIDVFWEGRPARVGYLHQLRLARPARARKRLLVEGYRLLAGTRAPDELPFDFTSVLADNRPARRLLEAGLPGLPRYTPLGEFVSLGLRPGRPRPAALPAGLRLERGTAADLPALAAFLDGQRAGLALAARWSAPELASVERSRGLQPTDFVLVRRGAELLGCAALWDQRAFKQVVVRGYAGALRFLRPLANALAPLLRTPRLPAVGAVVPLAFVSHLAVAGEAPEVFDALVGALAEAAAARGLETLVLGLEAGSPLLERAARRFRARRLRSVLYAVGEAPPAPPRCRPEAALL